MTKNKYSSIGFFGILLLFMLVVSINAVYYNFTGLTFNLSEDQSPLFTYNFSNITVNQSGDVLPFSYSITNFTSFLYPSQANPAFYIWFSINSTTGILTVNSTNDSMSGLYNVSVQALDFSGGQKIASWFYFSVNATNDFPNFTSINNSYNMTQNTSFIAYMNASDEEMHYPLMFNATNFTCSLAPWSTRDNCSLFSLAGTSNISSIINYTPSKNDVGFYYVNISVTDAGERYNSSAYPYQSSDYSANKTFYYSQLVNFTVFASLDINSTDCQNKVFQQNQAGSCIINITTKNIQDTFNVSSNATLRNYGAGNVSNKTWFLLSNVSVAVNFTSSVLINLTPQVTEIGNWSINLTLRDINFSQSTSVSIPVYVNKTLNYNPIVENISNQTAVLNSQKTISLFVWDRDLLIPDKNETGGGYNETLNFTAMILNQSNLSQVLTINGANNFSVNKSYTLGNNYTTASIIFTPNLTSGGDYTINLSAIDKSGLTNSTLFNLSINSNQAPSWTGAANSSIWENNLTFINFSSYVADSDNDTINFTFSSDTSFPSFTINATTGIANFTPNDLDVGQHIVTVNASDAYFKSPYVFNITVYNVMDNITIERPISATNAQVDSNSHINATEAFLTTISVYVDDNDLQIHSSQKSFFNENLSIVNYTLTGINSSLFSFVRDATTPAANSNQTRFYATFTPNQSDVGDYNITINITDTTGRTDYIAFNMTINPLNPPPNLTAVQNITSAVTRSLNYQFNATDFHDGNSGPSNNRFNFSYSFLNGTDFINNNQTIFNKTSGILNMTFNSTHDGAYRINITVNNSQNQIDSKTFWIFVYGYPNITFPSSSNQFYLAENSSYNFTFRGNHSLANNALGLNQNLTYLVYLSSWNSDRFLIYNSTNHGNNTNFSIAFTPNFTQETNGVKNLTVISYPSTPQLNNTIEINSTMYFNITVNHTDFPLIFSSDLGGIYKRFTGGSPLSVVLSDYFTDYDASDPLYNQTIGFNYTQYNVTSSAISVSISNWTNRSIPSIVFSSSGDTIGLFSITAFEYNVSNSSQIIRTSSSNNFSVELTVSSANSPSAGVNYVSSTVSVPVSLKIIVPGKISGFLNQKIIIPLKLSNKGTNSFKSISLNVSATKNGTLTKDFKATLDKNYFSVINPGESTDVSLTAIFSTDKTGDYEITVSAISKEPAYSDWGKIFINLQKTNESEIEKYIVFTEEYITQNPSCLELKEQLEEARALFEIGDYSNARAKSENVLNLCKEHVEQISLPFKAGLFSSSVAQYFVIALVAAIAAGLVYYYFKRRNYSQSYYREFDKKGKIGFKSNKDEWIGGKS